MPLFKIFDSFPEYLATGKIDLRAHALKVVLTNSPPSRDDAFYADVTEIAPGGGYLAGGRAVSVYSAYQMGGVFKLVLNDLAIAAVGGSIGPFRYAVLVDTTPNAPPKPLIGWWDIGASTTVPIGGTIVFDFSAAAGILQILSEAVSTPPVDESTGLLWGADGLLWGGDRLIWGTAADAEPSGLLWGSDGLFWGNDTLTWGAAAAGALGWGSDTVTWGGDALTWG